MKRRFLHGDKQTGRRSVISRGFQGLRGVQVPVRILQAIIAVNCAMLVFYITVTYRLLFHSDSAAKNLLAGEIIRTGQFFPADWNYVNGDLFVIFGHLFVIPLVPFVDNGFALHAVSGIVSACLIMAGLLLLLKELQVSRFGRLLFLALLTTGLSPYLAENLFGQVSYGALLYVCLFLIYFLLRYVRASGPSGSGKPGVDLVAIASIVFLVFLSNPARALASFGVPLVAGFAIAAITARRGPSFEPFLQRRAASTLAAVVAGVSLLGAISHHLVLTHLTNNVYQAAEASYLGFEDVVRNFAGTIRGLLFLLGGLPTTGRSVLSLMGLYEASRILFAAAVVFAPVGLLAALWRQHDPRAVLMSTIALAMLAIILFFQLFTSVPVMAHAELSSRYFVLPVMAVLIAALVNMDGALARFNQPLKLGLIFALGPLLVSGWLILVAPALQPDAPGRRPVLAVSPYDTALDLLREQQLSYGYAPYWQASVLTVLSGGDIKVRPIVVAPLPEPMRHLASNDWYRPRAFAGPTFMLLRDGEYHAIDWAHADAILGKPDRVSRHGEWIIVVYPFNISTRLSWATSPRKLDAPLSDYRYSIRIVSVPADVVAGETVIYELEVTNSGSQYYASNGSLPVNMGLHLLDVEGNMLDFDFGRTKLRGELAPGVTQRVFVPVRLERAGSYRLSFDLVQEGVTWFADRGGGSGVEIEAAASSPP